MLIGNDPAESEYINHANSMIEHGVVVESIVSGAGGGEIAISWLVDLLVMIYSLVRNFDLYRSAGVLPCARRVLMHTSWTGGPVHVTGNILHCLNQVVLCHMRLGRQNCQIDGC